MLGIDLKPTLIDVALLISTACLLVRMVLMEFMEVVYVVRKYRDKRDKNGEV